MKKLILITATISFAVSSSLKELENYALTHSLLIKKTKTELNLANIRYKKAKVSQFGQIDLVGSYTHYNIERTLAPLPPSAMKSPIPPTTTKDIYSIGINYSVPLFTGFAQTEAINISQLAKKIANAKLKLTKEQLIFNIRSLYLAILAQKEFLKAQINYLKALKKLKKITDLEVKLGKKANIDSLKIKSEIFAQKAKIEAIKANINITKAALSSVVGKDVKKVAAIKFKIKKPRYLVNKLYNKVLALSKVKLQDFAIAKANREIKKAKSSKYPQVALNAYAGKNYGKDIRTNNWDNESIWQVGVNVKYNFIDFGKSSLEVQEAKVKKLQAKLQKTQTMLDVKKDLIAAIEQIKLQYANYLANAANYKLAKKAENIELTRYKSNLSIINDLLIAKAKSQLALAKKIEAKYNYQKAKYNLDFVIEQGVK